jgi:hypothetical protein
MLDKFSQPVPMGVAFASAPLVPTQPPNAHGNGSLSSPTGKKAVPMESDHEDDGSCHILVKYGVSAPNPHVQTRIRTHHFS